MGCSVEEDEREEREQSTPINKKIPISFQIY